MDSGLWVPPNARVKPTESKKNLGSKDWGTQFDDELETQASVAARLQAQYNTMVDQLRKRPDHVVYVGSAEDREKMRTVFNHMFNEKVIRHHPTIKIDYGVPEGTIRLMEDRG